MEPFSGCRSVFLINRAHLLAAGVLGSQMVKKNADHRAAPYHHAFHTCNDWVNRGLKRERTYLVRSFYTADGSPAPAALLDTLGTAQGDTLILTDYSFGAAGLDRPTMSVRFDPRSFFPAYALAGKNADINPAPEGQILARTVMVATLARTYYAYLPASYSSGYKLSLVFHYHGYTANALRIIPGQSPTACVAAEIEKPVRSRSLEYPAR